MKLELTKVRIPLVIVIKDNVVNTVTRCKNAEEAEILFETKACLQGHSVYDHHFDNGYIEINNGSICLTWID